MRKVLNASFLGVDTNTRIHFDTPHDWSKGVRVNFLAGRLSSLSINDFTWPDPSSIMLCRLDI